MSAPLLCTASTAAVDCVSVCVFAILNLLALLGAVSQKVLFHRLLANKPLDWLPTREHGADEAVLIAERLVRQLLEAAPCVGMIVNCKVT